MRKRIAVFTAILILGLGTMAGVRSPSLTTTKPAVSDSAAVGAYADSAGLAGVADSAAVTAYADSAAVTALADSTPVTAYSDSAATAGEATVADSAAVTAYSDSAATIADGSIDSDALTTADSLSIFAPSLKVWSDTMFFSGLWCGYDSMRYDGSDNQPDTNFVACPIVGDTTNTFITVTSYNPWLAVQFGAAAGSIAPLVYVVGPLVENEGFWIRVLDYDKDGYFTCGYFWLVVRTAQP